MKPLELIKIYYNIWYCVANGLIPTVKFHGIYFHKQWRKHSRFGFWVVRAPLAKQNSSASNFQMDYCVLHHILLLSKWFCGTQFTRSRKERNHIHIGYFKRKCKIFRWFLLHVPITNRAERIASNQANRIKIEFIIIKTKHNKKQQKIEATFFCNSNWNLY